MSLLVPKFSAFCFPSHSLRMPQLWLTVQVRSDAPGGPPWATPSPLDCLYFRRRQNLCQSAWLSLRAFSSRGCREQETRQGADTPATKGDRKGATRGCRRGIPGQPSPATPVAGATNVAPLPDMRKRHERYRAASHPKREARPLAMPHVCDALCGAGRHRLWAQRHRRDRVGLAQACGLSGCRRGQRDKDAMLSPDGGGAGDALP
jgi:hypothetical protein